MLPWGTPSMKLFIADRLPRFSVLDKACTARPETADPVWLVSVPLIWTVDFGPAVLGLIRSIVIVIVPGVAARAAGTSSRGPAATIKTASRARTTERTVRML